MVPFRHETRAILISKDNLDSRTRLRWLSTETTEDLSASVFDQSEKEGDVLAAYCKTMQLRMDMD